MLFDILLLVLHKVDVVSKSRFPVRFHDHYLSLPLFETRVLFVYDVQLDFSAYDFAVGTALFY